MRAREGRFKNQAYNANDMLSLFPTVETENCASKKTQCLRLLNDIDSKKFKEDQDDDDNDDNDDNDDKEDEGYYNSWDCAIGSRGMQNAGLAQSLRDLEHVGFEYTDSVRIKAKYLGPVDSKGDCLFLALQQCLAAQLRLDVMPRVLRLRAADVFWENYQDRCNDAAAQCAVSKKIENMYYPSHPINWEMSPIVTFSVIVPVEEMATLKFKIQELRACGVQLDEAKEMVYRDAGYPVQDAASYCEYMKIRGKATDSFSLIQLSYSERGLLVVNDSPDSMAWGDDIILEALATMFERNIAVVLLHQGEPIVLNHEPYGKARFNDPLLLLMTSHESSNGGDHYEPLLGRTYST